LATFYALFLPVNAEGLNKPSCNACDIKHERFSDKKLDICEQELKRRENCFTKEKQILSGIRPTVRQIATVFNQCRRPEYVTLDGCFGSDTSKWDGSSVSDFETKAKDSGVARRGGASGGTRPGAQALWAQQHTFCSHFKRVFK